MTKKENRQNVVLDYATLKNNLINELESKQNHAWNDNPIYRVCIKLIKRTSIDDVDFQEVLKDGTGEDIVNLFNYSS